MRGLSLVELMVGITIGLFVVAAATTLASNQLVDNRRLLLELQIQQDLRATMDIMTRQLRRAGTNVVDSQNYVSADGLGGIKSTNSAVTPAAAVNTQTEFRFVRNAAEAGPFGFELDAANGVVRTNLGAGNWQELTDRNAMRVTDLRFDSRPTIFSARMPCPKLCPGGGIDCWPQLVIQRIVITITAEARSDATVRRALSSEVRVRNDWVRDTAAATRVCPA